MTRPLAYIGIDPGAKGAIALIAPVANQIETYPLANKIPLEIDHYLKEVTTNYNVKIILMEDVHSLFGMSAKSNFQFGWNVGMINTLARLAYAPTFHIQPKEWQKKVGVTAKGKAVKQNVAQLCEQLYPQVNIRGKRGGLLDGISDALLIAHCAFLTYHKED